MVIIADVGVPRDAAVSIVAVVVKEVHDNED